MDYFIREVKTIHASAWLKKRLFVTRGPANLIFPALKNNFKI